MGEFNQIRRLLGMPQTDTASKARALARLDEAIAGEVATDTQPRAVPGERRPRRGIPRRAAVVVGMAAAIALLVLVLQVMLPTGGGGPELSAASELRRLAGVVGDGAAIEPGKGFLYTDVSQQEIQGFSDLSSGASWDLLVRERLETWLAADGSGRQVWTVEDVQFASDTDRAKWVQAGRSPLQKVGSSTAELYGAGDLRTYDVASLPSEPAALRATIHDGDVIQVPHGALGTFTAIGRLLSQPDTPPQVRRGLFELAAEIPGVQIEPSVADPLGRPGEGFTLRVGSASETLVIDPETAQLLARVTVDDTGRVTWEAPVRGEVVATETAHP